MDIAGEWMDLNQDMRPKLRLWLPAAAMVEDDLRAELQNIAARGFGGVEVVVLSTLSKDIAQSEDGWGTKNWDRMVDIIADETKRLGLSMDIAIGPGWPIASPVITDPDDPAGLTELTYGVLDVQPGETYAGPLPERRTIRAEGTPVLVACFAYLEVAEKTLRQESYIDLMPACSAACGKEESLEGKAASVTFAAPALDPAEQGAVWKLFAFYRQPAIQKINAGQTYVIDHLGKAGAAAVKAYWDQVFAERKPYASLESFFCDSLEYQVALEWTADLPEQFRKRRGYDLLPYLPVIGITPTFPMDDVPGYRFEDASVSDGIRNDYLEVITQLYCEEHLDTLSEMAAGYGKTIRYQVAYNKPLEVERSALHVAIPENEALGRPSVDYMKTMAAAAHLTGKRRYSFECAAEFGHSYGQSYEDLFWWIKRAAMAGMNAQVLHGGCYSGRYEGVCAENGQIPGTAWPGYEGFGKFVSNYWNRTLSLPDARGSLDAITRMNTIFRMRAKVDCAIFRDSYINPGDAGEFCLYVDDGALANQGYSYEFVSEELLCLPEAREELVEEAGQTGMQIAAGMPGYRCLIIPEQQGMSLGMLKRVRSLSLQGFPVIWIGKQPCEPKFFCEVRNEEELAAWKAALGKAWDEKLTFHVETEEEVPGFLEKIGLLPRVQVLAEDPVDLMTLTREDFETGQRYYVLYRYNRLVCAPEDPNPDAISVSSIFKKGTMKESYERPGSGSERVFRVRIAGHGAVRVLDPMSGSARDVNFLPDGPEHLCGSIRMQEDEMVILSVVPEAEGGEPGTEISREEVLAVPVFDRLTLTQFGPDTEGERSFLRSHFADENSNPALAVREISLNGKELLPWKDLDPALEHFAGKGCYEGAFDLDAADLSGPIFLELGDVSDTFRVWVNGKETGFPDQVMKRAELTEYVHAGKNTLMVEVTSNLYNALFYEGMAAFPGLALPYVPRNYGIWECEGKKIRVICRG